MELEPPTIKKKTTLSLADLCAPTESTPPCSPPGLSSPPGLGFENDKAKTFEAPPGLPMPIKIDMGVESDATSAGSGRQLSDNEDSGGSDGEEVSKEEPKPLRLGLVLALAERNQLKSDSKPFCPMLPSDAAAMLLPEARTPLRTKLCAKAQSYVPAASQSYPFLPADTVSDVWEKFRSRYAGQPEFYSETDGVSSYDTSLGGYSEYDSSPYGNTEEWYEGEEWLGEA